MRRTKRGRSSLTSEKSIGTTSFSATKSCLSLYIALVKQFGRKQPCLIIRTFRMRLDRASLMNDRETKT